MKHKSHREMAGRGKAKSAKATGGTGGHMMPSMPMKKKMDNDCPKSGKTCKM